MRDEKTDNHATDHCDLGDVSFHQSLHRCRIPSVAGNLKPGVVNLGSDALGIHARGLNPEYGEYNAAKDQEGRVR